MSEQHSPAVIAALAHATPASSPISNLHEDILWHILFLNGHADSPFLDLDMFSPMTCVEPPSEGTPLTVLRRTSQVCRQWRNVLLHSPTIWAASLCRLSLDCQFSSQDALSHVPAFGKALCTFFRHAPEQDFEVLQCVLDETEFRVRNYTDSTAGWGTLPSEVLSALPRASLSMTKYVILKPDPTLSFDLSLFDCFYLLERSTCLHSNLNTITILQSLVDSSEPEKPIIFPNLDTLFIEMHGNIHDHDALSLFVGHRQFRNRVIITNWKSYIEGSANPQLTLRSLMNMSEALKFDFETAKVCEGDGISYLSF